MCPWERMALLLREKAAEREWRATIHDHGSEESAPRVAAWRALEGIRAALRGEPG